MMHTCTTSAFGLSMSVSICLTTQRKHGWPIKLAELQKTVVSIQAGSIVLYTGFSLV
jgi:hypothetical protein